MQQNLGLLYINYFTCDASLAIHAAKSDVPMECTILS
jgi:hypothetical protein